MTAISVALQHETVRSGDFRLTYTLLRTDPVNPAQRPLFGIACTAERHEIAAGEVQYPAVTHDASAARRLFRLLTENAVFPAHIGDIIQDFREIGQIPAVLP
jgi:hypothetical protein